MVPPGYFECKAILISYPVRFQFFKRVESAPPADSPLDKIKQHGSQEDENKQGCCQRIADNVPGFGMVKTGGINKGDNDKTYDRAVDYPNHTMSDEERQERPNAADDMEQASEKDQRDIVVSP